MLVTRGTMWVFFFTVAGWTGSSFTICLWTVALFYKNEKIRTEPADPWSMSRWKQPLYHSKRIGIKTPEPGKTIPARVYPHFLLDSWATWSNGCAQWCHISLTEDLSFLTFPSGLAQKVPHPHEARVQYGSTNGGRSLTPGPKETKSDLPTHISHNLVRQDSPPGRVEMDTAIYNSHAEARGDGEESLSPEWGQSHTLESTATMSLNWFRAISSILIQMKWASAHLKRLKQIEGGNHSW